MENPFKKKSEKKEGVNESEIEKVEATIDSSVEESILEFKKNVLNDIEGKSNEAQIELIAEKVSFEKQDYEEGVEELKSSDEFYSEVFPEGYDLKEGDFPETPKVVRSMRNTFRIAEGRIDTLNEIKSGINRDEVENIPMSAAA